MAEPFLHVDFQQPNEMRFNRARVRRAFIRIGQVHMRDARRLVMQRGRSSPGENPGYQTGRLAKSIGYKVPKASDRRPGFMARIAPNQKNGQGNRRIKGIFIRRFCSMALSAAIAGGLARRKVTGGSLHVKTSWSRR